MSEKEDEQLAESAHSTEKRNTLSQTNMIAIGEAVLKESMDIKIDTLIQLVKDLKVQGDVQLKNQRLEWGASNSGIESFRYCGIEGYHESRDIVPLILLAFRRGVGYDIDGCGADALRKEESCEDCEIFRMKLMKQIETLVGVKPRFEQDDDGKYWIYYE
jgi:hypothetical protein